MQRRPSQDHSPSTLVLLDLLHELRIPIFEPMALVYNDVSERSSDMSTE
jgi:hypothetical protein